MEVQLHTFLNSAVDVSEWSGSPLGQFTVGQNLPFHPPIWEEAGWVQSQSRYFGGPKYLSSLSEIEPGFLGHPAHFLVIIETELSVSTHNTQKGV